MRKIMLLATMVAMSMALAMPVQAQSRKDKKAAQKEQWEREQRQKAEEDALRHQMRMDSLKNAQAEQAAAAAKAKAEQERAAAEAEQLARRKTASEDPCQMYDDDEWFYATASKRYLESKKNLVATALLRSVKQQLLQKLKGKYQQVVNDYFDQMETEDIEYERQHIESAGTMVMQQMVNETYEVCRQTTNIPDAEGYHTMYMAIKISKKEIVEKISDAVMKEKEMETRFNEKKFRDSAFKVFEENNEKEYNEYKDEQK